MRLEDADRTTIIIAHRLSIIRSCDVICVVAGGRVIESGILYGIDAATRSLLQGCTLTEFWTLVYVKDSV